MFASQTNASVVARPGARAGPRAGARAAARVTAASAPDADRAPSTVGLPTRRSALAGFAAATASTLAPGATPPASAIGFQKELKKRDVGEEDYLETPGFDFRGAPHAGVKYYDVQKGQGEKLEAGQTAVLHYTCRYRGLTAVSSREARTLGGNRTIAEPLELKYGKLPGDYAKPLVRKTVVGIGAELRVDPELRELYVVNTVFAGPADRAGIKPQDAIVSIEGVGNLVDVPIAEIGALLAGEAGTDVNLEVRRKADGPGAAPTKLALTREATAVVPKKRVADVEGGGVCSQARARPSPRPWCTSRRRSEACASEGGGTSSCRRTWATPTSARARSRRAPRSSSRWSCWKSEARRDSSRARDAERGCASEEGGTRAFSRTDDRDCTSRGTSRTLRLHDRRRSSSESDASARSTRFPKTRGDDNIGVKLSHFRRYFESLFARDPGHSGARDVDVGLGAAPASGRAG